MDKRQRVFELTQGKCYYCGCDLSIDTFHIEHSTPKALGGKGGDNLVPSCEDCNLFKGSLSIEDFRKKIMAAKQKIHGRMICKYYDVSDTPVIFWFEKVRAQDGNL